MQQRAVLPSRGAVGVLALLAGAACAALLAGMDLGDVVRGATSLLAAGAAWAAWDWASSRRAWTVSPLSARRVLPSAFALGVPTTVKLVVTNTGHRAWTVAVFDEADPLFGLEGLPQSAKVTSQSDAVLPYTATAMRRGLARFGGVQLRWRSLGGCFEFLMVVGVAQEVRVYPNFAAVAGYAWLAGDRRLAQIGIKNYAQRGLGTDFRQLSEYRTGDPIRHIDWKATLRQGRPIVRQFQDERDQRVFFLLDCGRRMRADEGRLKTGGSHFDQALNAVMLLAYVALKEGDEVGAMTFGNPPGERRDFAPRKGVATLNALMNRLYDIEPAAAHSDYLQAARDLMTLHPRRALVIVLTNFRDEEAAELKPALRLLRGRHLVMVASLREQVLGELARQPLVRAEDAVEIAAAHLFEQSRSDGFARVVGNDALSLDVEPAQLPVALVNRYHAVKRAGLL